MIFKDLQSELFRYKFKDPKNPRIEPNYDSVVPEKSKMMVNAAYS